MDKKKYNKKKARDYYRRNKDACLARNKAWKEKNKLKSQMYNIARLYGLAEDGYLTLLDGQEEVCAICGKKLPLELDHCHNSNIIRGLLCKNCNRGLGNFHDNPELLQVAIIYLSVHQL